MGSGSTSSKEARADKVAVASGSATHWVNCVMLGDTGVHWGWGGGIRIYYSEVLCWRSSGGHQQLCWFGDPSGPIFPLLV